MGRSIDLYSYDYDELKARILDFCKTDNEELVEKILLTSGNRISDRYIILSQELWEDCNCYFNVANVLEKVFKVEDVFGNVFCNYKENYADKQDLVSAIEDYEIFEAVGLNCDDYIEDED